MARRRVKWREVLAKALIRGALAAFGGITVGAILQDLNAAVLAIVLSFGLAVFMSLAESTKRW